MSKIGRVALALQECAEELGFSTIQDALDAGYVEGYDLVGNKARLVKPLDFSKALDEQEKAHEAWLEEREEVFEMIDNMEKDIIDSVDKKEGHPRYWVDTLERIRAFVEKGEM